MLFFVSRAAAFVPFVSLWSILKTDMTRSGPFLPDPWLMDFVSLWSSELGCGRGRGFVVSGGTAGCR
jgi:hypothetical protein